MMFLSFPCFRSLRLIPSAPAIFRRRPFRVASGPCVIGGEYLATRQALGQICGGDRPILALFLPCFCFRQPPSDSVSFRYLPSSSISGRIWSVRLMATCLIGRMVMSGGNIWKPNMPWAKFVKNRPILVMFMPLFCFRQLPSASAIFRQLPFRVAAGPRV